MAESTAPASPTIPANPAAPVALLGNAATVRRFAVASGILGRVESVSGLTMTGLLFGAVAIAGWFTARAIGGKVLYLLVYTSALITVAAVIIARRKRPLVAERSKFPHRAREGQRLQVEITANSRRRLSTFMLQEHLHPHLGSPVRLPVATLPAGQDLRHTYTLSPRLRGVYQVGPLSATWGDPLGIARNEQRLVEPVQLIVHPTTEMVMDRPLTRQWQDPPVRPPVTKPWPTGAEFYGMRDYMPGDDLRRIVWKAVARTGKLLVRESEQGITDRVIILLDNDRAWHRPTVPSDTFETAIRAAASVGVGHIKDGFAVTIECNGKQLARNLRGPRARMGFLDQLAYAELSKDPLSLAIERLLQGSRNDAHYVIVTPHLDVKTAARMEMLLQAGASVLVVAVTWEESDPLTVQRANSMGAAVVKVKPGMPLGGLRHVVGAGELK